MLNRELAIAFELHRFHNATTVISKQQQKKKTKFNRVYYVASIDHVYDTFFHNSGEQGNSAISRVISNKLTLANFIITLYHPCNRCRTGTIYDGSCISRRENSTQ